MGLPPQLELLAVFSRKIGHDNMSERCNNICSYSKYKHTVSLRHGHTDRDRLCIHFPFFESFLIRVVPNNPTSNAHVILPSHIVFLENGGRLGEDWSLLGAVRGWYKCETLLNIEESWRRPKGSTVGHRIL